MVTVDGAAVLVRGRVDEANVGVAFASDLPRDSQWLKLLDADQQRPIAGGKFMATASADGYSYLVWLPKQVTFPDVDEISSVEIVADCLVTDSGDARSTCNRRFADEDVSVHYSFDASMLGSVFAIDEQIRIALAGWECLPKSSRSSCGHPPSPSVGTHIG
jgi:hypothetical protein